MKLGSYVLASLLLFSRSAKQPVQAVFSTNPGPGNEEPCGKPEDHLNEGIIFLYSLANPAASRRGMHSLSVSTSV